MGTSSPPDYRRAAPPGLPPSSEIAPYIAPLDVTTEARINETARPRARWRSPWLGWSAVAGGILLLYLVLPVLGLVVRAVSTGTFLGALTHTIVLKALQLRLVSTVIVLLLTLLLGSPLALVLARRRWRGRQIIDSLVDLPIVLPPAVAGVALLLTLGRRGVLGGALSTIGVELPFTVAAVVLAQLFVAAPFYVRAARSGFAAVPRELEEAAMVEGASSWEVFRHITAPLAAPALLGGAVLCWARALGEFGATIMFAGSLAGRTQTMPLAIYAALESDLDAAIGLSLVLLLVSFVLLVAFRHWLGRQIDLNV